MKKFVFFYVLILVFSSSAFAQEEPAADFVYHDHGKRDPMWPLVTSQGVIKNYSKEFSIADINIEGIMYEPEGDSIVIINGKILRENDTLGPFVVFSIGEDVVILKNGEQKLNLKLKEE